MSNYQQQKTNKPKAEDLINLYLSGELRDAALGLFSFFKENKMTLQWGSTNSFNVNYKGKRITRFTINRDSLGLYIYTAERDKFDGYLQDQPEDIKILFMENISKKCTGCTGCAPGKSFYINGKLYENICFSGCGTCGFKYQNPSAKQMLEVKKLLLARKDYVVKMLSMGQNPGTAR